MELSYSPKPQTEHITDIADQKHILEPTIVQDFQCRASFLLDRMECCNVTITWWVCRPKSSSEGSASFPTPHSCTSSETPRISLSKVAVVAVAIPVHPRFMADRHVTSQWLALDVGRHYPPTEGQRLNQTAWPGAPYQGCQGCQGLRLILSLPGSLLGSWRQDVIFWSGARMSTPTAAGYASANWTKTMEQLFLSENVWRLLGSNTLREKSQQTAWQFRPHPKIDS